MSEKKYQIVELSSRQAHAGTKAREDVTLIAEKKGFSPLYISMTDSKFGLLHKIRRQISFCKDWFKAYKRVEENSVVLLQHPFHYPQISREHVLLKLKKKKAAKFISVVHDVEELRTLGKEKYHKREFDFMLRIADILIVHNNVMRDFFISKGVKENKIIVLGIFDYIRKDYYKRLPIFDKSVTIAGNLDIKKSGYLSYLSAVDCDFYLYGPNYSLERADNITYCGVMEPDNIPDILTKGFGLIWDGDSPETCKGGFGDYLRYNSPHKLSLYLVSGLPVFIWKYAAEAKFVIDNNVGFAISSLLEIASIMENISDFEYTNISINVSKIAQKLANGEFINKAIDKAIDIVESN